LQAIAWIGLDGRMDNLRRVSGLKNPTDLAVVGDRIYAVERRSIAEIDIPQAKATGRYAIPEARLPNDIAAAADGSLCITDSKRAAIYRLSAGVVERLAAQQE
jgi:streptogramin lyase